MGTGTPNFDALKKMGGLTSITWDNVVIILSIPIMMHIVQKQENFIGAGKR